MPTGLLFQNIAFYHAFRRFLSAKLLVRNIPIFIFRTAYFICPSRSILAIRSLQFFNNLAYLLPANGSMPNLGWRLLHIFGCYSKGAGPRQDKTLYDVAKEYKRGKSRRKTEEKRKAAQKNYGNSRRHKFFILLQCSVNFSKILLWVIGSFNLISLINVQNISIAITVYSERWTEIIKAIK